MEQNRIDPSSKSPSRINRPVVIETRHQDWIRRDFGGVCFSTPEETYQYLKAHTVDQVLGQCVQITALLQDWQAAQPIRDVRKKLYGESLWAATTTLPVAKALPKNQPFTVEAIAYDGDRSRALNPSWMYDLGFMVLSLGRIQPVGEGEFIHIAGVCAWDRERNVLFPDNVEKQVTQILDYTTRFLQEEGYNLADLVSVRTFSYSPQAGKEMQRQLTERLEEELQAHHVFSTLDPADMGELVAEVQFQAVKGVQRLPNQAGSLFELGGIKYFLLAPIQSKNRLDRLTCEEEGDEVVNQLHSALNTSGLQWSNVVSLLVEVDSVETGEILCSTLDRLSHGAFQAGITASVNPKLSEVTHRRMVLSGTAIGQ